MPSFARSAIMGHLGRDPEMRYLPNGSPVTSFTVAISQNVYNRDSKEWEDRPPLWVRVSVWRDAAERANEKLRKGDLVYVEGPAKVSAYTTKDGEARASMEVTADRWYPLTKHDAEAQQEPEFN